MRVGLVLGAGGVVGDDRGPAVLADDLAALAECVHVAANRPDSVDRRPGDGQQLEVDRQEVLTDDVQPGLRQQVVDVGHPAGDRVVHRDHRQPGPAAADRLERVLERRTGQLLTVGEHLGARHRRVGAWLTLISDRSVHGLLP